MSFCLYRTSCGTRYLYVTSGLINQKIIRAVIVAQVLQLDLLWLQIPGKNVNLIIKIEIRILVTFFPL